MQILEIIKLDAGESLLRTFCAWLCEFIYPLIAKAFQLFIDISQIMVLSEKNYKIIYSRITVFLTIIMVFYVTFEFIKYLVQPDSITDKEKGVSSIGKKIIIVVVLIAFVPDIFALAWKAQNYIIKSDFISKIILGRGFMTSDNDKQAIKIGNAFSAIMFHNFYSYDNKWNDNDGNIECESGVPCKRIVESNLSSLSTTGELPNLKMGINAARQDPRGDSRIALISFDGLFATLVGAFILYILVLYAIDIAKRVFQFTYLQIIAPIPIIGYLSPKKDNIFSKWVNQCIATYIDLFIRLSIIYLVLLFSYIISNAQNNNEIFSNVSTSSNEKLIYIALIMGLLLFAQKVPKLIEELLPSSLKSAAAGNFGLKAGERVAPLAARTIGASYSGLRRFAGGAIARAANARRRNKLLEETTGKTKEERDEAAKLAKQNLNKARANFRQLKRRAAAGDKTAEAELTKSKNNLIEKESEYAAAMANKNKNVGLNAAAGAISGAYRGAKAGFGATKLEDIGKKAREGAAADKKAIAAHEEWLNAGGYSAPARVVSGIQQRLGISTAAKMTEREGKALETKIKAQETLSKRESAVKGEQDAAKDSSVSRLKAGKETTKVDDSTPLTIKDETGTKHNISDILGTPIDGETTSQISSKAKARAEQAKAAAEAAKAEQEKHAAKKMTSKEWTAAQESDFTIKESRVTSLESAKSGKNIWSSAQEQELQASKSRYQLLQTEQSKLTGIALTTWNLRNGAKLEAAHDLVVNLEGKKSVSWTETQEAELREARSNYEAAKEEKRNSWTAEDNAIQARLAANARDRAAEAAKAESEADKINTALGEYTIDKVLGELSKGETADLSSFHDSYVQSTRKALSAIKEASRDSETRESLKTIFDFKKPEEVELYNKFISGEITTYKELDGIQVALTKSANARGIVIAGLYGDKDRLQASSQTQAEQANDNAAKPN